MKTTFRNTLALAAVAIATQASAQVTFYERDNFQGDSFTTRRQIVDFGRFGFNDSASSVVVAGESWEVCEDVRFGGRCVVLRPGQYPSLRAMGLNNRISSVQAVTRVDTPPAPAPAPAPSRLVFYEKEGFGGRSFTTQTELADFGPTGFNDRASAIEVFGGPWEVCAGAGFGGPCAVLRPGQYPSLKAMGLDNSISSARALGRDPRLHDNRVGPPIAGLIYDPRRRDNEQLFEASVTAVRAVVGPPEQRCWVERDQVVQEPGRSNVPATIVGAVIGGILGHQVGDGRGRDLATVGGAVAGGAIGASIGRDGRTQAQAQDVQRCTSVPSQARPELWDVTYNFRGQEHRVQMTSPPGATIIVNREGEPRV